jgi:phosphoribosylformimino-5-aminoimidazole carboxamide ribotide isomerase
MKIIPAIDLIDGKCVRLFKGDYSTSKIYNNNPVEQARVFEDAGVKFLHIVDLTGAKAGEPKHLEVLEKICVATRLTVDFGGGIRTEQNLIDIINCGANQLNIGTILIRKPEIASQWVKKFGTEKLIASVDVKDRQVKVAGWQEESGFLIDYVMQKLISHGFTYFTVTDIDRDGTLGEPSYELYKNLLSQFPGIKLNASGGVSSQNQLDMLKDIGCNGAIVGKAIYEGQIRLIG